MALENDVAQAIVFLRDAGFLQAVGQEIGKGFVEALSTAKAAEEQAGRDSELNRTLLVALSELAYQLRTDLPGVSAVCCGGCRADAFRKDGRWFTEKHVEAPRWGLPGNACPVGLAEGKVR